MRRIGKILGILALVAVVGIAALIGFLALKKPAMRPPSAEKIEATPERLARGEYLVEHVTHCLGCHSDAYFERFALPIRPGTAGQGGFPFDKKLDVPGMVQAQNITPDPKNGIGDWTDGEVLRAMREGINRDGEAMFPMMPYPNYRHLSDEDAKAIVAYLRTIAPIDHAIAPRKLDFPVNFIVKFIPKPLDGPVPEPDRKDTVAYGRYLSTVAGCVFCHTPKDDKQRPIAGQELSGGWVLTGPWGRVVSSNITPDPDTYMGKASRDEFIDRFKSLQHLAGENAPVAPPGKNTVMAWPMFGGMTREDLGAIYDYLKTVKPIRKTVVAFPDAPAGSGS
jgi:mono/diheme cytochrome c family protein